MNNEIGRKLTSLTLMTIMLAGGMVIAAPGMVPEAAAAGQLYVSAENAQFGNLFGGGQVIEIIVKDPNRADTEVAEAEPDVYVDNNKLRLAQGVDGYWYAYIGAYGYIDDSSTDDFDGTSNNLDYGVQTATGTIGQHHLGSAGAGQASMTTGASETLLTAVAGTITNPPTLSDYNGTNNVGGDPVTSNADQSSTLGQIGVNGTEWPFIQLYDFTQGAFDIVLSQAGQDEIVTIDYDSSGLDSYAQVVVDRLAATQGSEIHLELFDQALNIDPTNEDIVIFYVDSTQSESSLETVSFTNSTRPNQDASDFAANHYKAENMGFGDNGVLKLNYDANGVGVNVLANDATLDDPTANYYLVFYEGADNSGVFYNTDDADDSNLIVLSTAKRGTTATIDYNDSPVSFIVTNDFGDLDMDEASVGDEWNSGETLAVTLIDQDLNKNTISDEDMTLTGHTNLIPSLQIGSPITLEDTSTFEGATMTVGTFNKIATIATVSTDAGDEDVSLTFPDTVDDFRTSIDGASFVYLNFDVSSVVTTNAGIQLTGKTDGTAWAALSAETSTTLETGLVRLQTFTAVGGSGIVETNAIAVNFTTADAPGAAVGDVLYADLFTFGDRNNNAIYRLLLEETDDNTGVFEGDVEFVMLNQINHDLAGTYSGLTTISDSIDIIVHEDLTDEDSPRINYLDLGSDGVSTQIADQVAAPSHSGVVTFDTDNYKTADTVVVTVDDQDLNTDSELIDVYITSANDHVGENAADSSSYVLDITFNDVLWQAW